MTDRPILFSGPMVRAILDGRKTMTRRVLKLPTKGIYEHPKMGGWAASTVGGEGCYLDPAMTIPAPERACIWHQTTGTTILPPYAPGDRLWVREAWRTLHANDCLAPRHLAADPSKVTFEADPENRNPLWAFGKLRPGMFMPRWASRLTLTVTDVRVQRLQDISEDDAIAEGCPCQTDEELAGMEARCWFRDLWDSLNDKRGFGWDRNPWCVAVTFTAHQRNIDQMEAPDA